MITSLPRIFRSSMRAVRIAIPALWLHLLWPLVRIALMGVALWIVIRTSGVISRAILARGSETWSAILAAKAIGAVFFASCVVVLYLMWGWIPMSKAAIALGWAAGLMFGFALASVALHFGDSHQETLRSIELGSIFAGAILERLAKRWINSNLDKQPKGVIHA